MKLNANHTAHLITGDKDKEIARLRQHLREKEHDDVGKGWMCCCLVHSLTFHFGRFTSDVLFVHRSSQLELTHFLEEERTVRAQMMADLEQKVLHLEERLQETSNALVTVQADADRLRAALLLAEQDRDDLNEVAMRLKEANYDLRAEADGLKGRLEQVTNELADVQCEKGELADYVAGYKEKTNEKVCGAR